MPFLLPDQQRQSTEGNGLYSVAVSFIIRPHCMHSIGINNSKNNRDNVYGAVIMTKAIAFI